MLKLEHDLTTGKAQEFEAKCCEHSFESACACCMAECDNCLEA
jgi:hypothetical protein